MHDASRPCSTQHDWAACQTGKIPNENIHKRHTMLPIMGQSRFG